MAMKEELLEEWEFIFGVDHEKGFKKLRDNQFPKISQGLIEEPIANALDQQQSSEPIKIEFKQVFDGYELTYIDNGCGLISDNLEALHFIGKTTKKQKKYNQIGRFGMGLIGAFHSKLGVKGVRILTKVCGQAVRILYEYKKDSMPTWVMFPEKENHEGFSITFFIREESVSEIIKAIHAFLETTIIPVIFNGNVFEHKPTFISEWREDILVHQEGDPEIYYTLCPEAQCLYFDRIDDVKIYVRNMLVQVGEMYSIFYSGLGDKMPINYSGIPYAKDERALILSKKAEPTIGRDKLVKNDDFEKIKMDMQKARVHALCDLLDSAKEQNTSESIKSYAKYISLANIQTLKNEISVYLRGNELDKNKEYYIPFIRRVVEYPLFPAHDSVDRISLNSIINLSSLNNNVLVYITDEERFSRLPIKCLCPFVLKEETYLFHPMWGGHRQALIRSILEPLLDKFGGFEIIKIDGPLLYDEERLKNLESRGVIKRISTTVRVMRTISDEQKDFINRLRNFLDESWFRMAIDKFNPPANIEVKAVESIDPTQSSIVAVILNHNNPNTLSIGINMEDSLVKDILQDQNGHIAFLPMLCQELTRRRGNIEDGNGGIISSHRYDWIELEDRVLKAYVKNLSGKDNTDASISGEHDMLIL